MRNAFINIRNGGAIATTAIYYGVLRTTLRDRLKGV